MTNTAIRPMSEEGALQAAGTLTDDQLDDVVREHLQDAIMVGAALTVRHERRTWRTVDGFRTWEEFCRERFGLSRMTAWRKMVQAKAAKAALPTGPRPSQRKAIEARSTVKPTEPEAPVHPTDEVAASRADEEENALLRAKVEEQADRIQSLLADLNARRTQEASVGSDARMSEAAKLAECARYLPRMLDLDAQSVAFVLEDPEVRWSTARRLRRWAEVFEMASMGGRPAPERSEKVTPRPKEKDRPKG
jgi:hypothetical protein